MPTYPATGIVIGRTNFGEADRIIRFFTPEHGKLSAVARGVRKIKSRAAGHLEPFGEVNLMLATGRGQLDVITSARLTWYPHRLAANLPAVSTAFELTAILDRLTEPGQPHPKAYRTLATLLQILDDPGPTPTIELWYCLQILDALGYRPELNHCLVCGYHDTDRPYSFNATHGGLVCERCAAPELPTISISAIKAWRLMSDYPYEQIRQLQDIAAISETTLPLAQSFLSYHAIG